MKKRHCFAILAIAILGANASLADRIEPLIRDALLQIGGGRPLSELRDMKPCGVVLQNPEDWDCPGVKNTSLLWRLHGFVFLDTAIRAGCANDELNHLVRSYAISWVIRYPKVLKGFNWAWNDDSTARRVERLSYYYKYFSEKWSLQDRELLKASLDAQADLLMRDSFYSWRHNHGMHQDFALVCYALLVCDDVERQCAVLKHATDRVAEYWRYAFAADGVHKEHSPSYAAEVTNMAETFAKLLEERLPPFSAMSMGYACRARDFLLHVALPDGSNPSIGDSSTRKQTQLKDSVVYPEGGYAIFRSSWFDGKDVATWVMLTAASHSNAHKHGDDLNVLVWHKGALIVEAGKRNYEYKDPLTDYAYSGYAHNVLCVDGHEFPVGKSRYGNRRILDDALKTRIVCFDITNEVKSVTGRQERFPGIVQDRSLRYNRQRGHVYVVDRLTSDRDFRATLIFHIAPDVKVVPGTSISFCRQDAKVAAMSCSGTVACKCRVVNDDDEKSPYRRWIFNGCDKAQVGGLVLIEADCHRGENKIVTDLSLY